MWLVMMLTSVVFFKAVISAWTVEVEKVLRKAASLLGNLGNNMEGSRRETGDGNRSGVRVSAGRASRFRVLDRIRLRCVMWMFDGVCVCVQCCTGRLQGVPEYPVHVCIQ